MSTEKRKPTWQLCVKNGDRWENIGAAWETERGNLFVKVDDGKQLSGTAMMFPYREKPAGGYRKEFRRGSDGQYRQEFNRPAMRPAGTPAPYPPPAAPPSDYMERKRQERRPLAVPPAVTHDDDDEDVINLDVEPPDAPEWL